MPRIEIIPTDYDPASGDGTPTVDVCVSCVLLLQEGDDAQQMLNAGPGIIGSLDVCHPNYSDGDYECDVCDRHLNDNDN